jgi:selenocysteine-specific elongation factor
VVTIGGGAILDAFPVPSRKQDGARTREFLRMLESGATRDVLAARIARRGAIGLSKADAVAETGWRPEQIEALAAELAAEKKIARASDVLAGAAAFLAAAQALVKTLHEFHTENPLVTGMSKEELRTRLDVGPQVFAGLAQALSGSGKIEFTGEQARLPGRGVVMKDDEAAAKQKIEQAFAAAGLKVPALKEVLASLAVDRTRAQKIVTLLLRDRVLVKLSDDLVFHRDALDALRRRVAEYKQTSPRAGAAREGSGFGGQKSRCLGPFVASS